MQVILSKTVGALCFVLIALQMSSTAHAVPILFEDFEDDTLTYTSSLPDALGDIANRDYYGRIDNTSGLPADVQYSNQQGLGFYGAQDTDGALPVSAATITLNWTGINISNFTSLNLSWFVAEDDAVNGSEDWDLTDSVRIDVQIDGGGFNQVFGIEAEAIGSDQVNNAPRVDTNFDGIGDGQEITDAFTQFNSSIADGSTLDIRLVIETLNAGDEDIAFDNLLLEGTSTTTTEASEPGALALIGVGLLGLGLMRRRKRT